MGGAGAVTVTQQRAVKQYGSLESARMQTEIKRLGLDNVSGIEDYKTKYAQASSETKRLLQSPAELSAQLKADSTQRIANNQVAIQQQIAFYKAKANERYNKYYSKYKKYKREGKNDRAERAKDQAKEARRYYKTIADELGKNINVDASYDDIHSYARRVGKAERDDDRASDARRDFVKARDAAAADAAAAAAHAEGQAAIAAAKRHIDAGGSPTSWSGTKQTAQAQGQARIKQATKHLASGGPGDSWIKPSQQKIEIGTVGPQVTSYSGSGRVMAGKPSTVPMNYAEPTSAPFDYGQGTRIEQPQPFTFAPPKKEEFKPTTTYLGGQEIRTSIQPQFGTIIDSGFAGVGPGERVEVSIGRITPDYSTTLKKRVTEFIPFGGGVPLSQMNEPVYLPTNADAKKLAKLIESNAPGAAAKVRKFLREQQAKLKEDIGKYNEIYLKAKSTERGLTDAEFSRAEALRTVITKGQQGTLGDVTYTATEEAAIRGETVSILGGDFSPRTARRGVIGGTAAYGVLTDVLAFQVAGAAIGGTVGATKTGAAIIKTATKFAKPLKYTIAPTGFGIGGFAGYQEYQKRGDMGDAIAVGAGATAGFFGGVYSKQIVEGVGKGVVKVAKKVERIIDLEPYAPKRLGMGIGGIQVQYHTGYSDAQVAAAKKYAAKKGMSLKDALKKLFGKGYQGAVTRRVKVVEIRDFIRSATPQELQGYVKAAIKNISRTNLSPAKKLKEIKLFLNLFKGTNQVRIIETQKGIQWQIFNADGQLVASGTYVIQATGQPLMVTKYAKVEVAKNIFQAAPTLDKTRTGGTMTGKQARSVFVREAIKPMVESRAVTGEQARAIFSREAFSIAGVEAAQAGLSDTSLFTGVAYALKEEQEYETMTVPALLYSPASASLSISSTTTQLDTGQDEGQDEGQDYIPFGGGGGGGGGTIYQPIVIPTPPVIDSDPLIDKLPPREPGKGGGDPGSPFPGIGIPSFRFTTPMQAGATVQAYHGEVMVGGKYKQVTDRPATRGGALDRIARIIDNTISAQGRVVPVKRKKMSNAKLQRGDGYYDKNKDKFRSFRLFGGKRIPMKDTIIEKKNRRIDTPGEKRGMGVAQFMKQGKRGRPKRKAPFRL